MSDGLWMFVGTVVLGLVFMVFAPSVIARTDRILLRAGLWVNGVDGKRADEIIEHEMSKER